MGRGEISITPAELRTLLLHQVGGLATLALAGNTPLTHIKLHGTLYHAADLVQKQRAQFGGGDGNLAPAHRAAVGKSRVRPGAHAMLRAEPEAVNHGLRVPGVSAAGDVGGGNPPHQRPSARRRLAFAQITIEVH
jgi:hypothetical protein